MTIPLKPMIRQSWLVVLLGGVLLWSTGQNILQVGQRYYRQLEATPDIDPARRQLLATLYQLQALPRSEKQQTVLFIPLSNRLYWQWSNRCDATPFIAPAITGIALVDGLPTPECGDHLYYGYATYAAQERSPQERQDLATNPSQLCEVVRKTGFSQVIIIDTDLNNEVILERRTCS